MPLLRRRPDESIQNAIDLGLARAGMTLSPSAEERPLVHGGGGDRSSFCCGSEGGDSYPGAEVATLKAEEELWEARQASKNGRGGRSLNEKYLPLHSSFVLFNGIVRL